MHRPYGDYQTSPHHSTRKKAKNESISFNAAHPQRQLEHTRRDPTHHCDSPKLMGYVVLVAACTTSGPTTASSASVLPLTPPTLPPLR